MSMFYVIILTAFLFYMISQIIKFRTTILTPQEINEAKTGYFIMQKIEKITDNISLGFQKCAKDLSEVRKIPRHSFNFYLLNRGGYFKIDKQQQIINIDNSKKEVQDFITCLELMSAIVDNFHKKVIELYRTKWYWSNRKKIKKLDERFLQFNEKKDSEIVEYFLSEEEREIINSVAYVKKDIYDFYKKFYNNKDITIEEISENSKRDIQKRFYHDIYGANI